VLLKHKTGLRGQDFFLKKGHYSTKNLICKFKRALFAVYCDVFLIVYKDFIMICDKDDKSHGGVK